MIQSIVSMKEELIKILCEKSFKYTETPTFKLVSGRMSQYYVNCKPTILSPRGMYLTGHLICDAVKDLRVSGVGGLTFGADPIAVATAFASELLGTPLQAFSIRKAKKDHGIARWIEGDLSAGDHVVIIDDVVTTGGSTLTAVERAREEGLVVNAVVALVDRQEGGVENINAQVGDVRTVITRDELMTFRKK